MWHFYRLSPNELNEGLNKAHPNMVLIGFDDLSLDGKKNLTLAPEKTQVLITSIPLTS